MGKPLPLCICKRYTLLPTHLQTINGWGSWHYALYICWLHEIYFNSNSLGNIKMDLNVIDWECSRGWLKASLWSSPCADPTVVWQAIVFFVIVFWKDSHSSLPHDVCMCGMLWCNCVQTLHSIISFVTFNTCFFARMSCVVVEWGLCIRVLLLILRC